MQRGRRWEEEIGRHKGSGRLRQGSSVVDVSFDVRTLQTCWDRPALGGPLEPGRGSIRSTGRLTFLDHPVGLRLDAPMYLRPEGRGEVEVLFIGTITPPLRSAHFVVNGDWNAAWEAKS